LLNELCDEKRFGKLVAASLGELREGIHDGLFTAQNDEENWHLAHRILVPAFGPLNISAMFDDMKDVCKTLFICGHDRALTADRLPASWYSSGRDTAQTM